MAKILLTPYWIEIQAAATEPAFNNLINNVSGIHATRRRNIYRCSRMLLPDVLFYLRGVSDPSQLPEGPAKTAWLEENYRVAATRELKEHGLPEGTPTDSGLWLHQQIGVELAKVNSRYNFFYDTRTGKTRMAYQIIQNALAAGKIKRCIVFTKSTIVQSWLEDAKAFPKLKVVAFYGNDKQKQVALHTPCHVIVWSTGMVASNIELIKQCHFDMCFFDESSALKNHRSQISKLMLDYCLTVPYWYNLTATPAPNGEDEYYVQMRTVDPYIFNPLRVHFVAKYFINMSNKREYEKLQINPYMKQEFMDIVESRSIYVDQKVMPTAGKEWHFAPFRLHPDVFERYEDMRRNLVTEAESTDITADTAAAMRAKLQQIVSGFIMDTDAIQHNRIERKMGGKDLWQEVYWLSDYDARIHCLEKLLTELANEKVVIWANYAAEFDSIKKLLGSKCRVIRGGTSIEDKQDAIRQFKHGSLQYLVCHPLSVGMGINLTESCNAVYYSINDSWEALKQSSERIAGHIKVQPRKCHYWILQAQDPSGKDLIDRLVYNNVWNKRDASTGFLDYLKAGVLSNDA